MSSLSVCVLAKNEERIIEKSLSSICSLADEIIFVDTGSTDKTLEIAAKYTNKIFHKNWNNDFASMYNFAFSKSSCDYCILWDADFVLQQDSINSFTDLKKANFDSSDQVSVKWNTQFDESGSPTAFVYRPLIFKTGKFSWKYPTHSMALPLQTDCLKSIHPEIVVDHEFDSKNRQNTTKKHNQIVLEYLKKNPNDPYMSFALIEELYTLEKYDEVITTGYKFINTITSFPFPVQLLELLFFSYLRLAKLDEGTKLILAHKNLYFHKSKKYDILYADILLYTDFNEAIQVFKHTLKTDSYSPEQDDEYDSNRLNHTIELAQIG
jgi:glycosyltransferase involved in cell wall biosynthesis